MVSDLSSPTVSIIVEDVRDLDLAEMLRQSLNDVRLSVEIVCLQAADQPDDVLRRTLDAMLHVYIARRSNPTFLHHLAAIAGDGPLSRSWFYLFDEEKGLPPHVLNDVVGLGFLPISRGAALQTLMGLGETLLTHPTPPTRTALRLGTDEALNAGELRRRILDITRSDLPETSNGPSGQDEDSDMTAAPPDGLSANGPNAPVHCSFAAEIRDVRDAGQRTRLNVRISREAILRHDGSGFEEGDFTVSEDATITVAVIPRHNLRVDGEDEAKVPVPGRGAPVDLVFHFTGLAPGRGEIEIEARLGPRRLTVLVLQPVFGSRGAVRMSGAGRTDDPEQERVNVRIIEEDAGRATRLRFIVESFGLGINLDHRSDEVTGNVSAYVTGLFERLASGDMGTSRGDFRSFQAEIENRGAELFRNLVPKDVRKTLWAERDRIGSVEVISDVANIPWEIAMLTDPATGGIIAGESVFLADLGLVRWVPNQAFPPSELRARPGRTRYIVPDYPDILKKLPNAAREIEMMVDLFAATAIAPDRASVLAALNDVQETDLIHFCCHGEAHETNIWDARLLLQGRPRADGISEEPLSIGDIQYRVAPMTGDVRPAVMLNACNLGRIGGHLTGTGGFAQAFVERGAGLMIGALWPIDDGSAHVFGKTFYGGLLRGQTVNRAVRAARTAARNSVETDSKNMTWLAYTIYGNPNARLREEDRQRPS